MQRVTQYQGPFKAGHGNSRSSRNAEPRARTIASPRELSPQSPQRDCTQRPGHNRCWRDRAVPWWQARPVSATGNRYPEGRTFAGEKTQTAAQSPGTTPFPRTLRLPEPFPRLRVRRLPASANTHKGRARACGRHPRRQARRAISRERQDTTPPKTGRWSPRARGQSSPPHFTTAFLRRWGLGRCSD